jgi:hypothetical protein
LGTTDAHVVNVSEGGVGVETPSVQRVPELGTAFEAKLLVGRTIAPVKVKLVHIANELIGLQFVAPTDTLRAAISLIFDPELVGSALRGLSSNASSRKVLGQDHMQRFVDTKGNWVETVTQNNVLKSLRVCVMGTVTEWVEGGLLTLFQNNRKELLNDFHRGQLVRLARSATEIPELIRSQLEQTLLVTPHPPESI